MYGEEAMNKDTDKEIKRISRAPNSSHPLHPQIPRPDSQNHQGRNEEQSPQTH